MANTSQYRFAALLDRNSEKSSVVIIDENFTSVSIYSQKSPCASYVLTSGEGLWLTNAGTAQAAVVKSRLTDSPDKFCREQTIRVGSRLSYVLVGDLLGRKDIVVTDAGDNKVYILQNRGNDTWSDPTNASSYSVGDEPMGMAIGDLFGNRRVDIAVANAGSKFISLLQNRGNGEFEPAKKFDLSDVGRPSSLAAGNYYTELSPNTTPSPLDIVIAFQGDDRIVLLQNNGGGKFSEPKVGNGEGPVDFVANFRWTRPDPPDPPGIPLVMMLRKDSEIFEPRRVLFRLLGTTQFEVRNMDIDGTCPPPGCGCSTLCGP